MKNLIRSSLLLLVLVLLVAACSQDDPTATQVPEPEPTEAPIEQPTEELAPEPVEEPTEAPIEVPTEEPAAEPISEPVATITGATWYWQEFQDQADINSIVVPDAGNYSLILNQDGSANIQADCNVVQGTYDLDGSSLTITLGASTRAFCGEESLDQVYLGRLSEVVTFVTEDGKLFLNLMADAGNMVFSSSTLDFGPEDITLDVQDLPYSYQAVVVSGTTYDESMPPGPMGLPEHIEILFGTSDPAERQPGDPIMYIIPVNAYRELWDNAGNESVSMMIESIDNISYDLLVPEGSGLPALPYEEISGVNDLYSQLGRHLSFAELNLTSATQSGYRFVGRWAQDANPITNQGLNYVYQGFTNDGKYLVSFFYPVSTDQLPADASQVSEEDMAQFNSDMAGYLAAKKEMLDGLTSDQWQPDLASLDGLVASLQVDGMKAAGLQDVTWLWTGRTDSSGGAEIQPVANPQQYQATYDLDGTVNIVADCNLASLGYTLNRAGMVGGMLAQPGPMTLAECEPGSSYNEFINGLMASQDYRVRPGGDDMQLTLPAGGGTFYMVSADKNVVVTPPAPEPGDPTATAIAPLGVNVRLGPGSQYAILGVAPFGTQGKVVGVSQDSQWWVVFVPNAPKQQGWVSAAYVEVTNADGVPVIDAPGLPIQPLPTPEAPGLTFTADVTTINGGETATLSWDVQNVQAVFMYPVGDAYTNYPVEGQGSRVVQPGITTSYELLVFHTDNTVETARIEIVVNNGLIGQWSLTGLSTDGVMPSVLIPGTQATAVFNQDGSLTGLAGCNDYSSGFTAFDRTLRIGTVTTSRIFCETPEGLMNQEAIFVSLLQQAVRFAIVNGQLEVYNSAGGTLLTFARSS